MPTQDDVNNAVIQFLADQSAFHTVTKGDANATITTDNGEQVKSLAGVLQAIANQGIGDSAAALINQRMFRSGTISERGPTPFQNFPNGLHFFVTDLTPPRMFCYTKAGNANPVGAIVNADTWYGYYTPTEIKNLAIDFTGKLPSANVAGLNEALTAYDSASLFVRVNGFRVDALSSSSPLAVAMTAQISGNPSRVVFAWSGYSVNLPGTTREFRPPNWAIATSLFVTGNSLSDTTDKVNGWAQLYAQAAGLTLYNVARYSSDVRQTRRAGVTPINLTVAGGILPATGQTAAISQIDGAAPDGGAASFLNTGDAGLTTGVSMAGTAISGTTVRHVVVSIPNAGSLNYSIAQDVAGSAAVTLTGSILFVPDVSTKMAQSRNVIALGNNMFYSEVANGFGDYTNPGLWDEMALLVGGTAGQPTIILPILPSALWTDKSVGKPYQSHLNANARTATLYPSLVARSTNGRTMLKYMQDNGNGSAEDNADIAAGFTPRSLRIDDLHLNAAGDAVLYQFVTEAFARLVAPPAITADTLVVCAAFGTNSRLNVATSDIRASGVRFGVEASNAANIASQIDKGNALFTRVGYLNLAGTLVNDANWRSTPLLDLSLVNPNAIKLLGQSIVSTVAFYDSNAVFLSAKSAVTNTEYVGMPAIPAEAAFVAFCRVFSSINAAVSPLLSGQFADINPKYSDTAKASNFTRKEFELFTRGGYINSSGNLSADANWAATELIDVSLIDVTNLSLIGTPIVASIAYYTSEKVFISKVSAAANEAVYSGYPALPAGTVYVAFTRRVNPTVPGIQKFNWNPALRNIAGTAERAAQADRESKRFSLFTRAGYLGIDGSFKADANWLSTELFTIAQYKSFAVRLKGHTIVSSIAFYNDAKQFISGVSAAAIDLYVTAYPAIPAGAVYVAFTSKKATDERFLPIMEPKALPSPNVLAGRFPVELSQYASIAGSYYNITNGVQNDVNWRRSGFVKASTEQLSVTLYGHPNVASVQYFDANKALLGYYATAIAGGGMFSAVLTPPAGTEFIRFSFGDPAKLASATSASIATTASVAALYLQAQNATSSTTPQALLAPFRAPRRIPFVPGMKNILYGDSRSSTDYTWYKTQMEAITGASFYNGGWSGHSVAQNASDADLQRIFDYNPQGVIIILPGGNNSGQAGTVGTFNGTVADEAVVVPSDYSVAYAGTTFIQAVDYQVGRIKRQYENIRTRAALTGSETEAEKNDKIRALIKPMIILLTDLPQLRTDATNVYSSPDSWRRKRDAIVEVGHRHKVHTIDSMYELSLDMSIEPYFVAPTDKTTNNGVYFMDGLHQNEFGIERLTRRIASDIL